jgi:4-hydroxy-2-oxovalerate aldolase
MIMTRAGKEKIHIVDTTLRDGSHSVKHRFTIDDVVQISTALNDAGVYGIEITHGDGLAGSSIQYGFSLHPEEEKLNAVKTLVTNSKIAVLLLPGIGTKVDLQKAIDCGAKMARIATHVTEADIAEQHIKMSKEMGLETIGFLMLAHMEEPEKVLEQALMMESYGADVVYVVDSAGAMLPDDVRRRVSKLKDKLHKAVGFHAHNNLGLAVGNTLAAVEEGATYIDGCLCGLGAGAGNSQTEILVAVLDRLGFDSGVNLYKILSAAEDTMRPRMHNPQVIDRASLALGYAGVYSSFLLHTYKAAEKFDVEPLDILIELGKLRVVGGQEDMIVDVAYRISQNKNVS